MSNHRVAICGVGQTERYKTKLTCSLAGLVREAALNALADAGCEWSDIDALIIGKAPDMFEGVVMPEAYLAEALGGVNKPVIRVHTAGSVGGSTAIVAANHIKSGLFKRVLPWLLKNKVNRMRIGRYHPLCRFDRILIQEPVACLRPLFANICGAVAHLKTSVVRLL